MQNVLEFLTNEDYKMKPIKIALAALTLILAVTVSSRAFSDDDYDDNGNSVREAIRESNERAEEEKEKVERDNAEMQRSLDDWHNARSIARAIDNE